MFAPKNILVPTDFSEHSDRELAEAVDIARQHKARIYLLHVLGVVRPGQDTASGVIKPQKRRNEGMGHRAFGRKCRTTALPLRYSYR